MLHEAFTSFVYVLQCLVRVYTRKSGLHDFILAWQILIDHTLCGWAELIEIDAYRKQDNK